MLFSGVRSSCDMLARNCDLYLDVSASCSAFCSQRRGRHVHLLLLALDLFVLLGQQLGFLLELIVGLQPLGRQRLRLAQQLFGQRPSRRWCS